MIITSRCASYYSFEEADEHILENHKSNIWVLNGME